MPTLRLDAELHYDDIGEGPPVVLLHGVTSTGALEWRGIVGTLADDYRCIAPDLRGHGRSERGTRPLTVATLVDDLFALCEHLELSRPHLVGFSLGSHAVLRAALVRAEVAASLTLIGFTSGRPADRPLPVTPIEPPEDWPVALRRAQEHLGADAWHDLYSEYATDLMREPEPAPEVLKAIACPVLVILGAGEPEFKHRQARDLAEAVDDGRVEILDGAGHPVHQEQAHTVNRMVLAFVNRAERDVA